MKMPPLSAADVSSVLECIQNVHAIVDFEELPAAMLRAVAVVVRAKHSAFTVVDPVLGETSGCLLPAEPFTLEWVAPRFQANVADHPVVAYAARTRDGSARAISDFLTPRQLHATGLYRDLYQPMGIEDQLSIGMVGSTGLMIGLSFNRARRGFSDRDRAVLNVLRPHLLQAYLSCRDRQLLRNADGIRRGTVVDRLPVGLVCVDRKGVVIWSTEPAQAMLGRYFADASDSIHGLPNAVRVWLKKAGAKGVTGSMAAVRPGFHLTLLRCPLKSDHAVLLLQETPIHGPTALGRYGLTAREEQVMQCLLTGATAAQSASQLDIRPRTLQKHLERVFRKMEVSSLSAAVVKVLGAR